MLSSNLCRCTGYQNIVKAVQAARAEMRPPAPRIAPSQEVAPAADLDLPVGRVEIVDRD